MTHAHEVGTPIPFDCPDCAAKALMSSYSEITFWRSFRRFAWKPWTAEFTDDKWAYAVDGRTRRGVLRKARAWRNSLIEVAHD
jgi:hypothetical protein